MQFKQATLSQRRKSLVLYGFQLRIHLTAIAWKLLSSIILGSKSPSSTDDSHPKNTQWDKISVSMTAFHAAEYVTIN